MKVTGCETERVIIVQRWHGEAYALLIANLSAAQSISACVCHARPLAQRR
jgi:hypothetical protein